MHTQLAYRTTVGCYFFILFVLLLQTFSHPPQSINANPLMLWLSGTLLWLFKICPMLLVLPGLRAKRYRSGSWLSFLSMLYFIFGVLLIFTAHAELWGWLLASASFILFNSSMFFTRWRKIELAQTSPKEA